MKYLTLYVNKESRIDIDNAVFTGVETVRYNGSIVSKKWSMFGAVHKFKVTEYGKTVEYEVSVGIKFPMRIGFDIFRDNTPLLLS